jgi:hypothetical protein
MKLSPHAVEFYPASYHNSAEVEEELMVRLRLLVAFRRREVLRKEKSPRGKERRAEVSPSRTPPLLSPPLPLFRGVAARPCLPVRPSRPDEDRDNRLTRPQPVRCGRRRTHGAARAGNACWGSLSLFSPASSSPLTQLAATPHQPPTNAKTNKQTNKQDLERVDAWLSLMADLDEEDEMEEVEEMFVLE